MKFNEDFIAEVFNACLNSQNILDICTKNLKYQYFESEIHKKCFKYIFDYSTINSQIPPTLGIISQEFDNSQEAISFLAKVKNSYVPISNHQKLIDKLEEFIKKTMFVNLYSEIEGVYNRGEHQRAISELAKKSEEIHNFTLGIKPIVKIFEEFNQRQAERIQRNAKTNGIIEKLSFGIPSIDEYAHGGWYKGTSILIMGQSGSGKSTFGRWIGVHNARLGKRVIHFQAEGSKQDCLDSYDSSWTGINIFDIERGDFISVDLQRIEKARKSLIEDSGEIYVHVSQTFDSMSIEETREILYQTEKDYGKIDLAIWDYAELFTLKTKHNDERKRREEIANKITNIAVEFNIGACVLTQSMDIHVDLYNNPDFVLKRQHISEFKGMVKPFSAFLTINQTSDESNSGLARIHVDKFRKGVKGDVTFKIAQSLEKGKFININKTSKLFM
jgi:replicative DNA helicase